MKTKFLLAVSAFAAICATGCSSNGSDEPTPTPDPTPSKLEIKISPSIGSTKATDFGFESGDKIGLYVVNYNGTVPGTLSSIGNHVDNMRFTYSGTWTPDSQIFWKDNETHADFYLYYPYRQISDVTAVAVEAPADQTAEANYKGADFMIGKTSNVQPSESAVGIAANHLLSRVNITVAAGNGFTEESLGKSEISVKVNGLYTNATVNLATAEISLKGDKNSVSPYKYGSSYKAIVIPQSVEYGNLITVTVDGRDFNYKKDFTFVQNKEHNFTITVSKTSNGINVNINPWENDGTDNGGVAE
ncbi:MAG: fimbrillin family protein [Muribaculum sp.]|nr:fimbrillin family protein [Muribaculum sp.]